MSLRRSARFGRGAGTWMGRLRRAVHYRARYLPHALRAWANRPPRKIHVQLQTVSACNGRCVICPYPTSWHAGHPGRMSDALYDRLLAQLADRPIGTFCPYLQNEPLLDAALPERLRQAAAALRFDCLELATNAAVLTDARAAELADILAPLPHRICVSFHGVEAEGYHRVMGLDFGTSLARVVALLRLAEQADLHVEIKAAGRPLDIPPGPDDPARFSPEQFEAFWNTVCGDHGLSYRPMLRYLAWHDRAGQVDDGNAPARRTGRRSLLGFYCDRVDRWLHVLYNGEVILCCNDYHRRTVLGNAAETGLDEILRGPAFRRHRLMAMGLAPAPDDFLCRHCFRPGG